jgi:hypothetical protein
MPLSGIVTCIAGEWEATVDLDRRDSCDPQLVACHLTETCGCPVDNAWRVAAHVSIGAVAGASVGAFVVHFCVPRRLHPEPPDRRFGSGLGSVIVRCVDAFLEYRLLSSLPGYARYP